MINTSWRHHIAPPASALAHKRVLIRVDFNVPVIHGRVVDDLRIQAVTPYIKELSSHGAKVIILSHFGEHGESIEPVARTLQTNVPNVTFIQSTSFDEIHTRVASMSAGECVLLENVRMFPGEEDCIPSLSRSFASLGDVFINDAFSVSHRDHASVTGIPRVMLSYFGPTFITELEHLAPALTPTKPALLIIGGSKISTKLSLVEKYLYQGVSVFVGGAMVHTILRQRGLEIGDSFYEDKQPVPESLLSHPNLLTPEDVVLATGETVSVRDVPPHGVIVDCGKDTIAMLQEKITFSSTIIMNGPVGLYEKGWLYGTEHTLLALKEKKSGTVIIGGGDTLEVADHMEGLGRIGYMSLGGGAMLAYLANGTLPGIDAVTEPI